MGEIYSEARCSVILLRGLDLTSLVEAEKSIGCDIDNDEHSCLRTQSYTILAKNLTPAEERDSLAALKALHLGRWRRRAWTFQEILLSQEYVLSADNHSLLKLSDAGVLASIFYRRRPREGWLGEFADWCRRLAILRNRYFNYELSPANILQVAGGLTATIEVDRYYALCGALRLKDLEYNVIHSAEQALKALVLGLTKRGTLSWMHAIPPHLQLDESIAPLRLIDQHFSPYFDHKFNQIIAGSTHTRTLASGIAINVVELGTVSRVESVKLMLEDTINRVNEFGTNFPREYQYMKATPSMLHHVARDIVDPLLQQPLLGRLCKSLGVDIGRPQAEIVWRLYTLSDNPGRSQDLSDESVEDDITRQIAIAASLSLRDRIGKVQNSFTVVWWYERWAAKDIATAHDPSKGLHIMLGQRNVPLDARVCVFRGQAVTMDVSFANGDGYGKDPRPVNWFGTLHHIGEKKNDVGAAAMVPLRRFMLSWMAGRKQWTTREILIPLR